MAVIEKGKYRWNNVLSVPYDELIVPVNFKGSTTYLEDGVFYSGVFDAICVAPYNDDRDVYMEFGTISVEPITNNVDTMPFVLRVYDSGDYRDYAGWSNLFTKDLKYFTLEEDCDVPDDFYVWFRYNTKKIKDGDTADSAKARVKSLIRKINKETGKEHSNLSDGVETLVLGFGVDKTEVFDGNIELEGEFEPGEPKITDYYEEGYNKGYSEGLEAGGGPCGNKNIIEVDELPTDNIDKDAVYQITKKTLTEIVVVDYEDRYVIKRNGYYYLETEEPYLVSNLIYEPTRPTQNIQESYSKTWCIYYIEDENSFSIYQHGEWGYVDIYGFETKRVISDVKEATEDGWYAVVTEQKSFYQINSEPFADLIYKDPEGKIINCNDLAAREGYYLNVRIVPTRPTENIIGSTLYSVYFYFLEDEHRLATYADSYGWYEFEADVGIIFSLDEATEADRVYVLYQKWNKYIETSGYSNVIENGTYNVENVENVIVDIPNKAINGVWNFNVADDGWIDFLPDEDFWDYGIQREFSWDVSFSCVFNGEVAHFISIRAAGDNMDDNYCHLEFLRDDNYRFTVATGFPGEVHWCGTEQFPTNYTMSTTIDFGDEPQIVPELFMNFMAQTAIRQEAGGSYEDGYNDGFKNGKNTLYGTYILKETISADELPSINATQNLAGKGARAYFHSGAKNYFSREVEKITFKASGEPRFSVRSKSAYSEELDITSYGLTEYEGSTNQWVSKYYLNDRVSTYNTDTKSRIITFAEPITVSEAFYNAFSTITDISTDIYIEGENKGIEQGKKSQYDEFWDNLQNYGKAMSYNSTFSRNHWNDTNYKPKYPILATELYAIFNGATQLTDTLVPITITGNVTSHGYAFNNCSSIVTIRSLTIREQDSLTNCFVGCINLENLELRGTLGTNGLDLRWSTKLSKASWINIVGCYSTTISGLSMTGSLASVNSAFETSEGANDGSTSAEWLNLIATRPNVAFNLV